MEIGLKARIDETQGAQVRINDRQGAQGRKARINDELGAQFSRLASCI